MSVTAQCEEGQACFWAYQMVKFHLLFWQVSHAQRGDSLSCELASDGPGKCRSSICITHSGVSPYLHETHCMKMGDEVNLQNCFAPSALLKIVDEPANFAARAIGDWGFRESVVKDLIHKEICFLIACANSPTDRNGEDKPFARTHQAWHA